MLSLSKHLYRFTCRCNEAVEMLRQAQNDGLYYLKQPLSIIFVEKALSDTRKGFFRFNQLTLTN